MRNVFTNVTYRIVTESARRRIIRGTSLIHMLDEYVVRIEAEIQDQRAETERASTSTCTLCSQMLHIVLDNCAGGTEKSKMGWAE